MNRTGLFLVVAIIVAAGAAYWYMNKNKPVDAPAADPAAATDTTTPAPPTEPATPPTEPATPPADPAAPPADGVPPPPPAPIPAPPPPGDPTSH